MLGPFGGHQRPFKRIRGCLRELEAFLFTKCGVSKVEKCKMFKGCTIVLKVWTICRPIRGRLRELKWILNFSLIKMSGVSKVMKQNETTQKNIYFFQISKSRAQLSIAVRSKEDHPHHHSHPPFHCRRTLNVILNRNDIHY